MKNIKGMKPEEYLNAYLEFPLLSKEGIHFVSLIEDVEIENITEDEHGMNCKIQGKFYIACDNNKLIKNHKKIKEILNNLMKGGK